MREIISTKVCVVGGAGFLGSHLVKHLIEDRNCEVLVLDNLSAGRREFVHDASHFEHCDITGSEGEIYKHLKAWKAQYVFNYAAIPYIPVSFDRPLHVFNVNAFGAMKVVNAAQEAGCKGILQVSSAEIYGDSGTYELPLGVGLTHSSINEEAIATPHSSYGASKLAIDALVQARWREAKTPCIALRQFNCVGERETHPYVVPEIISQLANRPAHAVTGMKYVYLGNNSYRDFLYAGDAVRMAVELLERGEFGEVYNLGSEKGSKIYDLARTIGRLMGFHKIEVVEDQARKRPWEIWHLQSDNSKIYKVIPSVRKLITLEEALGRTIDSFMLSGEKWVWE